MRTYLTEMVRENLCAAHAHHPSYLLKSGGGGAPILMRWKKKIGTLIIINSPDFAAMMRSAHNL